MSSGSNLSQGAARRVRACFIETGTEAVSMEVLREPFRGAVLPSLEVTVDETCTETSAHAAYVTRVKRFLEVTRLVVHGWRLWLRRAWRQRDRWMGGFFEMG